MAQATYLAPLALACLTAAAAFDAVAQPYPSKPTRIVAASAGSSGDFSARIIAAGLTQSLGEQVIVENHAGNVSISAGLVAHAAPDGYTLLYMPSSLWLYPLMLDAPPYDPVKDFAPITMAGNSALILLVHPSLGVRTVKELITLAKERPGELNYGSPSTGSATHIAAEMLKSMAGVNIVRVPYKRTAAALNDLLGGQVQLMFSSLAPALPHIKSERLRGLAITSAKPSPLAPGFPTLAESGLPDFQVVATQGLFGPAAMPAAIVQRLSHDAAAYLARPAVREKLLNAGTEVIGGTPDDFAATIKSEMTRLGRVIEEAHIRPR